MDEKDNIKSEIMKCIIACSDNKIKQISSDNDLVIDLCFDSLQIFELVSTLERKFEIIINEQDFLRLSTVQDVVSYVNFQLQNKKITC